MVTDIKKGSFRKDDKDAERRRSGGGATKSWPFIPLLPRREQEAEVQDRGKQRRHPSVLFLTRANPQDDVPVAGGCVLGSGRSVGLLHNFGVDSGEWRSNKGQLELSNGVHASTRSG